MSVRRVWVVGNSGSGKTTLAATLAARLGVPHIEIDAIHHQPNWQPLDPDELRRRIALAIESDGWVVDGNYSAVAEQVRARADTLVWIDLTRSTVLRQIVARTVRRLWRHEILWNGNRERWRNLLTLDPNESVIMWAWTKHAHYAERYAALAASTVHGDPTFVRLTSRSAVEAFLRTAE
jgi:adenylate kinase family enzyme